MKVNVAPAAPETLGLNVIVNGTLCPAGMVTGRESPLITKTELLEVAPVTVTLPPLACNVPDAVPLVPTTTLPRPRVLGLTPSCAAATVLVPSPESGIVTVGFDPFELMVTLPVTLPVAFGEKETLNVVLWEAFNVMGAVIPLI